MRVTALAPWFGSNRILAAEVGRELSGCSWVGIVFAGGLSELACIPARTLQVNDKHRHVINYARVAADPVLGPRLYRKVRRAPFHPEALAEAQAICREREEHTSSAAGDLFSARQTVQKYDPASMLEWAAAYHVAAWMPRHGTSGTKGEFDTGLSVRWNAGGGDSATHYHSATRSLVTWRRILQRANFTSIDFREFLDKCKDEEGIGIYSDSPFPGPGGQYKHTFSDRDFWDLSARLSRFKKARVVIRYYDHPLIRTLYPEGYWTWRRLCGRKQTNDEAPELLILNGPSLANGGQP